MLPRKCWLQIRAINGGCGSFFFKSIVNFSTTTTTKEAPSTTRNDDMVDYLINSLGFSKDAAITTLSKVPRSRPSPEKADSVVSYLENSGLSKTHIRIMISGFPPLLCCNVGKTLKPKFKFYREFGLSGLDLCRVISCAGRYGLYTSIKPRVLYLKELLGSDENVVKVLKKYPRVLGFLDNEIVDSNVKLLRNYGITDDNIVKWITTKPRTFFVIKPDGMKEVLHRVENVLGIPRESAMFRYGVDVLCSLERSKVDEKFGVFQSFGWPESEILKMVRRQPVIFTKSATRIQQVIDYFMNELGYSPSHLVSNPSFLTYSFEKRVKPRIEVLKILNEKKLNKRKAVVFSVMRLAESEFLKYYILPYKVILPDLCDAYLSKTGTPKIKQQ